MMKITLPKQRWLAVAIVAGALLTAPGWASATPMHYATHFTTLNNSGVTGGASLLLNGNMLTVNIRATGLQPNEQHIQHIHGTFGTDGNPSQAMTPTLANDDTNGDGVIELGEGGLAYGPILVPLTPFSSTPDGTLNFSQTYDLTESGIYSAGFSEDDLLPLNFREIVLHGLNAPIALTDGGVNYTQGQYDPVLPVASGVLRAVPEPDNLGLMAGGLGLLLGFLWLRRKTERRPTPASA